MTITVITLITRVTLSLAGVDCALPRLRTENTTPGPVCEAGMVTGFSSGLCLSVAFLPPPVPTKCWPHICLVCIAPIISGNTHHWTLITRRLLLTGHSKYCPLSSDSPDVIISRSSSDILDPGLITRRE